jgi:hypothetical protein
MLAAAGMKLDAPSRFQLRESILQNKLFFSDIYLGLQIDYELLEREVVGVTPIAEKGYQGWLLYLQWFTLFLTCPLKPTGESWGRPWHPVLSMNGVIKVGTYRD